MIVKPKVLINGVSSALKTVNGASTSLKALSVDRGNLLKDTLDALSNSNRFLTGKLDLNDFIPVRKIDVNKAIRCPDDEIFFFKNGNIVIPNLHKDSLFSEFKMIKSISDEALAKQQFERVTKKINAVAIEHCKQLGAEKSLVRGLNPHTTIYDCIRAANYTKGQTANPIINAANYLDNISKHGKDINVYDVSGWVYHVPPSNIIGKHSGWRLSLNAKIDKDFIEKLDNYLATNKIQAKYKMPDTLYGACTRPDTYTIYFYNDLNTPLSNKIQKDIINLSKPYIRESGNIYPVGKELSQGVFVHKEPSSEDLKDLMKVLYAINPCIAKKMTLMSSDLKYPMHDTQKLSAGQVEAAKIFVRMLLDSKI